MRIRPLLAVVASSAALCQAQSAPIPAPGLPIPSGAKPWVFEEFRGSKQLIPMHSSAVQVNNHKGGNIAGGLLAGPFYKAKMTTEIQGRAAKTVIHAGTAVFYLHFNQDPDSGQSAMAGWAIVHAIVDNDADCSPPSSSHSLQATQSGTIRRLTSKPRACPMDG